MFLGCQGHSQVSLDLGRLNPCLDVPQEKHQEVH